MAAAYRSLIAQRKPGQHNRFYYGATVLFMALVAVATSTIADIVPDDYARVDSLLSENRLVRGPYLQQGTESGVTVRWRTSDESDAVVRFGKDVENLNLQTTVSVLATDHSVTIEGLSPGTRYYYSIGDSSSSFRSDTNQYFETHPKTGNPRPTRIWVLGDSGTADTKAAAVRDAYVAFNSGHHADVWLMLGDNAYNDGTDEEYQNAVFDMYPQTLRNSVLWSTLGNHDGHSADSPTQSGPYYDIFSFPTAGESGGISSGTEAYYSFDYGNIHFISLDSYDTNRWSNGAMATWLQNDLAATAQEWIIAFWHHPPYSKGSHDSDQEARLIAMREKFLPILENHGVDLVLGGHSHSYERSMLINGHYGASTTFDSVHVIDSGDGDLLGSGAYEKPFGNNSGTVYSVSGSSGKTSLAPLNHPVMISNVAELGSMVIDIYGNQLDAVFLNDRGMIRDSFSIVHESMNTFPPEAPSRLVATAQSASAIRLTWIDRADNEDSFSIERSNNQIDWIEVLTTGINNTRVIDTALEADTIYYYRIRAKNTVGNSSFSNTAYAVTDAIPDGNDQSAVELGSELLDHSKVIGPRWSRINVDPTTSGIHTISVAWEGNAKIRYSVFRVRGRKKLAKTEITASPSKWSGKLDVSESYFLGVWSESGSAVVTATMNNSSGKSTPLNYISPLPAKVLIEEGSEATLEFRYRQ